MHKFENLLLWQRTMDIATEVIKISREFPKNQEYIMVSQLQRACISIPSNIAEGCGRRSPNEFIRFLRISNGSSSELRTQLILCKRLGYIMDDKCDELIIRLDEIERMNYALQARLKKDNNLS